MKQNIDHQKNDEIAAAELLNHVRLSINPRFQDWVLFKNGTYIIFDNADVIPDLESEALKLVREFGPVYVGTPAADFDVTDLNKTEGWIVSGHGYGMYTYVIPDEMKTKTPTVAAIGLYGRNKRNLDSENALIIHVNRKVK
jgi:hypothetical protein